MHYATIIRTEKRLALSIAPPVEVYMHDKFQFI